MRNISKLLELAMSTSLVLMVGLTATTHGTIRNAQPIGAPIAAELTWAYVKASNSEVSRDSAKALTQEGYQSELAKLDALDRAKDLKGLVRVGDDLEKRWGRPGGQYYGLLMLEISNLLENHFSGTGTFAISQKFVSSALTRSDSFPLWLEIRLLRFLSRDLASPDSSDTAAWAKERRSKVGFWLHAWGRLETQINRNFNFADRSTLNVSPPKETGLPAGIVPRAIKDPKLRAQYEAALAANAKKGREYSRQFELRKLDETFPKVAEGYVVRVYSRRPYRTEELRRHLITHRLNRQIRERVLS